MVLIVAIIMLICSCTHLYYAYSAGCAGDLEYIKYNDFHKAFRFRGYSQVPMFIASIAAGILSNLLLSTLSIKSTTTERIVFGIFFMTTFYLLDLSGTNLRQFATKLCS